MNRVATWTRLSFRDQIIISYCIWIKKLSDQIFELRAKLLTGHILIARAVLPTPALSLMLRWLSENLLTAAPAARNSTKVQGLALLFKYHCPILLASLSLSPSLSLFGYITVVALCLAPISAS